jgi:hypothetical protein
MARHEYPRVVSQVSVSAQPGGDDFLLQARSHLDDDQMQAIATGRILQPGNATADYAPCPLTAVKVLALRGVRFKPVRGEIDPAPWRPFRVRGNPSQRLNREDLADFSDADDRRALSRGMLP